MFSNTETFDIIIDIDSIYKRYSKIPNFERALDIGLENGISDFALQIVSKLEFNLAKYGLGNSNLSNDVQVIMSDDGVYIGFSNDYYMYVEFGTGIIGLENQHPSTIKYGWDYDVNQHGESGWWYPSTDDDPNPTKYTSEKTGKTWAWTRGQASRPFMYDTWLWGSRSASQIINKHIRKEFRNMERDSK